MLILICFVFIFFIPSIAEAWGPLTHVYLANQVLDLGTAAVPAGIFTLIKKCKNDFLYGNLCADIILGKRFQGITRNSHSWNMAWKVLAAARSDSQKAFAYGYLTHLSADTVVHNLENSNMPFKHSFLEVKSESLIDKKYRKVIKGLDKIMQKNHDIFLEDKLESVFFSFKTNRRIFKSFLVLSRLPNYTPVSNFIDNRFPYEIPVVDIYNFQQESLSRMCELLNKGKDSEVQKSSPAKRYRGRASKLIRRAS
jgi:hypothetical protein